MQKYQVPAGSFVPGFLTNPTTHQPPIAPPMHILHKNAKIDKIALPFNSNFSSSIAPLAKAKIIQTYVNPPIAPLPPFLTDNQTPICQHINTLKKEANHEQQNIRPNHLLSDPPCRRHPDRRPDRGAGDQHCHLAAGEHVQHRDLQPDNIQASGQTHTCQPIRVAPDAGLGTVELPHQSNQCCLFHSARLLSHIAHIQSQGAHIDSRATHSPCRASAHHTYSHRHNHRRTFV